MAGSTQNEYMDKYRKCNPDYVERSRNLNRLRGKAQRILAMKHQEEYKAILKELKDREGLA